MNLQLSLKKQWFDLTKSGIKTEDYREVNLFWAKRLLLYQDTKLKNELEDKHIIDICYDLKSCKNNEELEFQIDNWYLSFKNFDSNIMTLGYPKSNDSERILKLEHKGIEIGCGNPKLGAEPNKLYFIIKHGAIL